MTWQGRTAVVTGIARPVGIGQACAKLLYKQGYNVIGIDKDISTFASETPWPTGARTEASTDAAAQAAPAQQVAWLTCDLSQQEQTFNLSNNIRNLGVDSINVLVNNAGIVDPYMKFDSLAERAAAWSKYITVNLTAPFLLSEVLSPLLVPGDSCIIHISSTRALQSEPYAEGYHSAKAGLLGLTHAQAATMSAKRIRVNAICPGWIDTSGQPESESGITKEHHEWHWTGRVGRPDDIAEMVCFLANTTKSGFITGQHFVVDGGVTKKMVYPE